jgi:hypothetical protein
MTSLSSGRLGWLALVVVVAAVAGASAALAAYPQDSVAVYTGCLNSGGQIGSVAVGTSPAKPCGGTETLVHLSGGTITQVTAGSGLTGGGSNGYVTLGLQSGYQLPQNGCSSGQFVASDGAGSWSCQSQTTYSAGTGLDLSGNTFSVSPGYRLPQSCSDGQVATSNGDNTWSCHSTVGSLSVYTKSASVHIGDDDTKGTSAFCDSGDIATGGGFLLGGNAGIDLSNPTAADSGWSATATVPFLFGFGDGSVSVYVKCLHIG